MSFLSTAINIPSLYGQQAAAETERTLSGISPNYYDHFRSVDLKAGYVAIAKPVKDGEPIEPFTPDNVFGLKDKSGNTILHQFVALEGMPIGYFMGGILSNFEPSNGARKGKQCQTTKAVLKLPNGETKTVVGARPIQSSTGITYNFRKYNEDKEAPGVYPSDTYETFGMATAEFAAEKERPVVMSCAECVKQNLDRYDSSQCRTSGEFAFYIYRVAFRGQDGTLQWVLVEDLGIESLGKGFILVNGVKSADLKKPDVDLAAKVNSHIPSSASTAHFYVTSLYKKQEQECIPFVDFEGSPMQLLAYPTQMFVGKLSNEVGKISHCFLYSVAPVNNELTIEARHALLETALTAYQQDRAKDKAEEFPFYQEIPTATLAPAQTSDSAQREAAALFLQSLS
jgi:hypothetical protein